MWASTFPKIFSFKISLSIAFSFILRSTSFISSQFGLQITVINRVGFSTVHTIAIPSWYNLCICQGPPVKLDSNNYNPLSYIMLNYLLNLSHLDLYMKPKLKIYGLEIESK
jgi:hypothetical protein